jgi:hypothetical protein
VEVELIRERATTKIKEKSEQSNILKGKIKTIFIYQ